MIEGNGAAAGFGDADAIVAVVVGDVEEFFGVFLEAVSLGVCGEEFQARDITFFPGAIKILMEEVFKGTDGLCPDVFLPVDLTALVDGIDLPVGVGLFVAVVVFEGIGLPDGKLVVIVGIVRWGLVGIFFNGDRFRFVAAIGPARRLLDEAVFDF